MKKKISISPRILWPIIGVFSVLSLAGIIYFVYYNSQTVHEKKYTKEQYEKDANSIKLTQMDKIGLDNAKEIYQRYLANVNPDLAPKFTPQEIRAQKETQSEIANDATTEEKAQPIVEDVTKQSPNEFIRTIISFNANFTQNKNIDVTFTALNWDENEPDYLKISYWVSASQDKYSNFPTYKFQDVKVKILQTKINIQSSDFILAFNKKLPSLKAIINDPSSSDSTYFESQEFKQRIFDWFKELIDSQRPNVYPVSDYDFSKLGNTNFVTYDAKKAKNNLTVSFYFRSKTDPKFDSEGQKIAFYIE
ncbi:hypothetical protein ACWXVL_01260 [Mycoplasma sp. 128]|uniref:hypothetical protein n=1 Tax=Mycoplasma sp. 3341 TaxID=3447506 RepID=UPI003F65D7CF